MMALISFVNCFFGFYESVCLVKWNKKKSILLQHILLEFSYLLLNEWYKWKCILEKLTNKWNEMRIKRLQKIINSACKSDYKL